MSSRKFPPILSRYKPDEDRFVFTMRKWKMIRTGTAKSTMTQLLMTVSLISDLTVSLSVVIDKYINYR